MHTRKSRPLGEGTNTEQKYGTSNSTRATVATCWKRMKNVSAKKKHLRHDHCKERNILRQSQNMINTKIPNRRLKTKVNKQKDNIHLRIFSLRLSAPKLQIGALHHPLRGGNNCEGDIFVIRSRRWQGWSGLPTYPQGGRRVTLPPPLYQSISAISRSYFVPAVPQQLRAKHVPNHPFPSSLPMRTTSFLTNLMSRDLDLKTNGKTAYCNIVFVFRVSIRSHLGRQWCSSTDICRLHDLRLVDQWFLQKNRETRHKTKTTGTKTQIPATKRRSVYYIKKENGFPKPIMSEKIGPCYWVKIQPFEFEIWYGRFGAYS